MMNSWILILTICCGIWLLFWVGIIPAISYPLGASGAFLLLDMFGFFRREKATIQGRVNAKIYEQKYGHAMPDVKISIPDSTESFIIIKSNGEIIIEGDMDPKIVEAAQQLKEEILLYGTELVAKEFAMQMKQYFEEKDKKEKNKND